MLLHNIMPHKTLCHAEAQPALCLFKILPDNYLKNDLDPIVPNHYVPDSYRGALRCTTVCGTGWVEEEKFSIHVDGSASGNDAVAEFLRTTKRLFAGMEACGTLRIHLVAHASRENTDRPIAMHRASNRSR
jgi:hypothetical protein